MTSEELNQKGFGRWLAFGLEEQQELMGKLPTAFGVYAIRRKLAAAGLAGSSDLVYVGSAANQAGLRQRIRQYFHPGPSQRTNRRIREQISGCTNYEISWATVDTAERAKSLEKELLARYRDRHASLPEWNRRL